MDRHLHRLSGDAPFPTGLQRHPLKCFIYFLFFGTVVLLGITSDK